MPDTKPSDGEINAVINKAPEEIQKIVLGVIQVVKTDEANAESRTQTLITNIMG
jgi:hypothetical protein